MANSKKPVHEIRMGRIRAAVWENETKNGNVHNVTISRLYKDDNASGPTPIALDVRICRFWQRSPTKHTAGFSSSQEHRKVSVSTLFKQMIHDAFNSDRLSILK